MLAAHRIFLVVHVGIRPGTIEDFDTLVELHHRSWRVTCTPFYPQALLDEVDDELIAGIWRGVFSRDSRIFVAMDGETMVGHIDYCTREGEPETAEISRLYLDPDYWRRGIGTLLLEHAVTHARSRGYKRGFLWVVPGNDGAEAFYLHHGWTKTGESAVLTGEGWTLDEIAFRKEF